MVNLPYHGNLTLVVQNFGVFSHKYMDLDKGKSLKPSLQVLLSPGIS
jgi:hypothetical protein